MNLSNSSLPSGLISSLSQGSDRDGAKSPSDKDSESSDWDSWDEDNNEVFSEQPANIQYISEDVFDIPYTCTGIVHIFPFLGGIPLFKNKKSIFLTLECLLVKTFFH